MAIANYVAKKDNGSYKLYNALTYSKESWQHTEVGLVDFYYPQYHEFDLVKANKLDNFIKESVRISM